MPVDAKTIAVAAAGSLLVYSGVKGHSFSSTFKDLLTGNNPQNDPLSVPSTTVGGAGGGLPGQAGGPSKGAVGDTGAHSVAAASAQKLARGLAPQSWRSGSEWQDWLSLWNEESGWSNTAMNPHSGAFGIAQALPSTKMPLAGQPTSAGGSANVLTQIRWGIKYIKDRYGSPSAAWAHELTYGWY
jgi:hypothetical protein